MPILIFCLLSGLTDQKNDIISIIQFCITNNFPFTIKHSTCRDITDPNGFKTYDFKNLFNENIFLTFPNYVPYSKIEADITTDNTYNFYDHKIIGRLWKSYNKMYFVKIKKEMKHTFLLCGKKYVYIGGSFWYYYNDAKWSWLTGDAITMNNKTYNILKMIEPSNRILDKYNEIRSRINVPEYNFIHYRYESDWEKYCKNTKYLFVCPTIDILINEI